MLEKKIHIGEGDGYFTGHLLASTPQIMGSCFDKAVIYMCAHNKGGAMGLIVNRRIDNVKFPELVKYFGIKQKVKDIKIPVYFGGPVETKRCFILHTADFKGDGTIPVDENLSISSSVKVLEEIISGKGPADFMILLGYAGWGAGQLEAEMRSNSWLTLPFSKDIIFSRDNDTKWLKVCDSVGVNPYHLSDTVGYA